MKYTLERDPLNKIPTETIIDELRKAAKHFKYIHFTRHEFDRIASTCKGSTVLSRFGTWEKALKSTRYALKSRPKKSQIKIPNEELFAELERIWHKLGHRPSRAEWDSLMPKYSYTTYKTRFNGRVNACVKFIEYKGPSSAQKEKEKTSSTISKKQPKNKIIPSIAKRNIPDKLRVKVFQKDNFKCVYCDRSPATHKRIYLHVDHIVPFSRGGKTILENLQTLCQKCNWGKGIDFRNKNS